MKNLWWDIVDRDGLAHAVEFHNNRFYGYENLPGMRGMNEVDAHALLHDLLIRVPGSILIGWKSVKERDTIAA